MYISILFGAAYGMIYGLFLSCLVSILHESSDILG
jgi:hypothetical protein